MRTAEPFADRIEAELAPLHLGLGLLGSPAEQATGEPLTAKFFG